jgi:hypothetical protein
MRVRKPLGGPEVIRTEERVLVLEQWPSVSHIYAPRNEDTGMLTSKYLVNDK